jgi:hypothetical protein
MMENNDKQFPASINPDDFNNHLDVTGAPDQAGQIIIGLTPSKSASVLGKPKKSGRANLPPRPTVSNVEQDELV